jgi:N-acetylmuramoyl-L-alanine amidase
VLLAAPVSAATLLRQAALSAPAADGAQLTLELSAAPANSKVFTLSNPERLVIDLPRTSLAKGARLPAPAGPVTNVRDGRQGNTLRLVLDLKQGLPHQTRVEGRKLIVQLGRTPAAPAAAPAPPTPVRAQHAPEDAGRDVIVAIDPGHGGDDPGAIGKAGTREKEVVLAIARALAGRIDAEPGMKAILTRNDDRRIDLRERFARARRAGADLFISVHADANHKSNVTGSSVYVLSEKGASSEAARWLAEKENESELKGGIAIGEMDRVGTIRKTQVQGANFMVLKSPDIPSILVETAFISNPGEERKLRSAAHQQAVAEAIFTGVREYLRQNPPDGTLLKRQRDARQLIAASPPNP